MTTLPAGKILLLSTGLAGSLLINLTAQFPSASIADIQGALAATPDEASWILTAYLMASLVGVVASGVLIKTLSIGRYVMVSAAVFSVTALAATTAPALPVMIALRALQGFAAGGFGPAAFVAVFVVTGGPRLAFGVTLLAFTLLIPGTIGPVLAGFVEHGFGWQTLFFIQAGIGAALVLAAYFWLPRQAPDWSALKVDWLALSLVSLALALSVLVLGQGTRRAWFESEMIAWSSAAAVSALAAFALLARFSPLPVISPRLLVTRRFGLPIALNVLFRAGLVVTSYLVPQFLALAQGYRPREIAALMLWTAIPQVLALPLVWRLMHLLDARFVMALGLVLCAAGTLLLAGGTSQFVADQFRLPLAVFGIGQVLFLVPAMVVGSTSLKPADLPTASLAFNVSTIGGTTAGAGLVSHLVVPLASAPPREALVLAFNNAFLAVAAVLVIAAFAVIAIGKSPRLSSSHPRPEPRSASVSEKLA